MNGNNDNNDVSSMYDNKTTTVVNVDEKHSTDTTVEQKQPISSAPSNSSFGLQLTEEEIREAESWKIDNKEGRKARLRDDHDFGPILTFLKGGTMGESEDVEKIKNLAKNYAILGELLVTRRPNKQSGMTKVFVIVPNKFRTLTIAEAMIQTTKESKIP